MAREKRAERFICIPLPALGVIPHLHMPGQNLCQGLCSHGKEVQEGLQGSWMAGKGRVKDIFSPFPIKQYLQHVLVVLSMQHSRNCCQGNTRLDLQGHQRICKLRQKEILFSKWSAQNVHEPSCEINWQRGIFKHGLMNCKHKGTDRLRAPWTCPASFQLPELWISHPEVCRKQGWSQKP